MKTTKIMLLLPLLIMPLLGQGTVQFNNRLPADGINAPFTLPDGTGLAAGYTAELALIVNGSAIPLTPTTVFRTDLPAAAGYVVATDITVPGIPGGNPATLVMRAFATSAGSFDNAVAMGLFYGESNPVTVILGNYRTFGIPTVPAPLLGLGWAPAGSEAVMWSRSEAPAAGTVSSIRLVPEPSVFALAAAGIVAVFASAARRATRL